MLEKKNDALIAAKAVLARYGGYLQDDPAPLGPRPRSQLFQAALDQWKAILAALGAAWASAAQMPSILIHAGEITMHPMDVEAMPVASLRPYVRNARTHSRKQIRQIANSIERFVAVRRGLCVSGQ